MLNKELFIKGYIEKIANKFELSNDLAFEIFVSSVILNKDFDEVFENISTIQKDKKGNWSGANDGGFDGIYIDSDEFLITVIQVKNQKNLGENEIAKFIDDFESIFVYSKSSKVLNKTVQTKRDEYLSLIHDGYMIEPKLYFVFNGEINHQNNQRIKRFEDEYEYLKIIDNNILFEKIENIIFQNKKRKEIKFTFKAEKSNISLKNDPQALISFSVANVKAVNFRLKAIELCELIELEKKINKNIDTLFSDNIRGYLGNNKTNDKIRKTLLSDEAEYFPFLNNGITIVANIVNIPKQLMGGVYNIMATNPVIVNGLQTTRVIYDIYQKNKNLLEGIDVLVRLYETNDDELLEQITDATNTQSPISYRDKISNKKFNQYAKELFESYGIGYITKKGDTFANIFSKSLKESVDNEVVLKFWYASFFERPAFAKSYKSKVMEFCYEASSDEKHPLYSLFDGNKNSPLYLQLFISYKIYDFVVKQRKLYNKDDDFIYSADELMVFAIYKSLKVQNKLSLSLELLEIYNEQFQKIQQIVRKEKDYKDSINSTYSHNDYFKSEKSFYDLMQINQWKEDNKIEFLKGEI
jgi:hypothetical protein